VADTVRAAIIGGSGFYQMEGLSDTETLAIDTPYGATSDAITVGELDGQRVAFSRLVDGVQELVWQRADATTAAEPLVRGGHVPSSWSPDGQHLATVLDRGIWIVTVARSTSTLDRLSETSDREWWPEFSPDGRWLAYGSNATGRNEIYVQPWPGRGPREQVSLEGGASPACNPGGRELFFVSSLAAAGRSRMWAVDVETSPRLRIGTPRLLFDSSETDLVLTCLPLRCHAVSLQGDRFFATQAQALPPTPPVTHVTEFYNDKLDFASADLVTVIPGQKTGGIDAHLAETTE